MENPDKVIITGPIGLALRTALRTDGSGPLTPGQPHLAGPMAADISGTAASLSQTLLHLNMPTQLIAKVGADPLGMLLHNLLEDAVPGMANDLVVDPGTSTAYQLAIQPAEGAPTLLSTNSANDHFYASDLPRGALQGADLFLFCDPFGMRSIFRGEGGELVSILNKARRAGMTTGLVLTDTAFNLQTEPMDWLSLLRGVDLLLADLDAFKRMLGLVDAALNEADNLAARLNSTLTGLMAGGPKLALVYAAGRGLYLRTKEEPAWKKGGRALARISPDWFGCDRWQTIEVPGEGDEVNSITSTLAGFIAGLLGFETPGTTLSMSIKMISF